MLCISWARPARSTKETSKSKQLLPWAQAPACEAGRMARAFRGCCSDQPSVAAAAKIHESHGERDSQRLFKKFGLRLGVATSTLNVEARDDMEPVDIPYLDPMDFYRKLLNQHPRVLFGGFAKGPQAEELLTLFWDRFELYHPEHEVFRSCSREERRRVLPVCIHGDKGRGYQKSPVFVFSWETVFALPQKYRQQGCKRERQHVARQVHGGRLSWSCAQRARDNCCMRPEAIPENSGCTVTQATTALREAMGHNGKGNSLFSRYLITAIPKKVLAKNSDIVPTLLTKIAESLSRLFYDGIQDSAGDLYKVAFIGCKGDFEFLHLDAGMFNRTYLSEGRVNYKAMCPECWAGLQDFPATDVSDVPSWFATMYQDEPWETDPPLNKAPYANTKRAGLYKRDFFHMLKYGFCRDLAASILFLLCRLTYFDPHEPGFPRNIDARLERAYAMFAMWCAAEGKCPTLKRFTPAGMHRKKAHNFPWLGGKGADTVLCMMFLDFFTATCKGDLRDPSHRNLLEAVHETLRGGLDFMGVVHSHGLFLTHPCAVFLHRSGLKLLRGYHFLAEHCINAGLKLFSLRPKCHYFHHTLKELEMQIYSGHRWVLSPAIWNCENNEDFIGRLSRLSRRVSPRLCSIRVIDRYLVGVKLLFQRAGV